MPQIRLSYRDKRRQWSLVAQSLAPPAWLVVAALSFAVGGLAVHLLAGRGLDDAWAIVAIGLAGLFLGFGLALHVYLRRRDRHAEALDADYRALRREAEDAEAAFADHMRRQGRRSTSAS